MLRIQAYRVTALLRKRSRYMGFLPKGCFYWVARKMLAKWCYCTINTSLPRNTCCCRMATYFMNKSGSAVACFLSWPALAWNDSNLLITTNLHAFTSNTNTTKFSFQKNPYGENENENKPRHRAEISSYLTSKYMLLISCDSTQVLSETWFFSRKMSQLNDILSQVFQV